ncbi:ribonuclease P [cyanobacterium endosymbiont of Rhopalodia gibberula]|uniref:ribonuclease P protein component n=1 Tax=cyanobacterium endosymbiont of Rhopalodia gibberula TaxID=1763363 RepID=UPI000DC6E85A|nr:ribonuclease P protein component [cyanobacterium endosymbiont of Rhopalodia gibberula]BBA80079.1 ribonuclease P [cyanobacterium endosymbiont of Rhopalodia gibberula]
MGLPKVHRLKKPKDFQAVYKRGQHYKSSRLLIRVLLKKHETMTSLPTQFGISVSQKISKKAVVRNRLKRQIKAAIRSLLPIISPGLKVVITVRHSQSECNYDHFLRELKQLFIKSNIVYGHTREYLL